MREKRRSCKPLLARRVMGRSRKEPSVQVWQRYCNPEMHKQEGGMMRSQLVTAALRHVPNRYLLTILAAKALRAFHRPNTRIAGTANEVLHRLSVMDPVAPRVPKVELRRAN
jgi:hypothetical protein